jgi:hypothetical protein
MPYTIEGSAMDGMPEPIRGEGTTFVPLANVAQSLGGYADFDNTTKAAMIELGDYKLTIQNGNPMIDVNGQMLTLQAPPFIQDSMMWVPVRLFEALGYTMQVDGDHIQLSS